MEPYLITLEVYIAEGGSTLLSFVDPKGPPDYKRNGHADKSLEELKLIFREIGLGPNIPQLEGTGKRTVSIEMFANEQRLTALGFNEVGAIAHTL